MLSLMHCLPGLLEKALATSVVQLAYSTLQSFYTDQTCLLLMRPQEFFVDNKHFSGIAVIRWSAA